MADAQKTIDLIFNGIDKTGAATLSALNNAKSFTSSLQNATQPIADFTVGALKLEAGLLAAGLAMTVFAVHTAGGFEQAFAQISTLFDASDADMATFKDNIKDYAATSGKSIDDIMASLLAAIGSGVKYTDALGLMTVAEKLAIATKADMKGATEVLVSTMNAYGMSINDAGKVSDILFQTIKDGKIEMNDLSRSLSMVTPIAAASGVSLEQVGAAVATLTASGIAPATAIEYLRSMISNIIKPSMMAKEEAERLGIAFDANALKSKGLAGVLDDVAKATGGNAGPMAKLIGDVGGLVGAMVLTGPQAGKFKEAITSMGDAAGSVDAAYKKMADSMDVVKQRVTNAFSGMMIAIGTPLLDEFGGLADAIAKIFLTIGASVKDGALKDLAAYVEAQFGSIQKALETVAKNLPAALASADFSGFKGGLEAVISALKKLFDNIDITTVEGLKTAIETVGAAFFGLSKYVAGVIEAFKPLFDALVSVGKGVKDVDLSFLEIAGNLGGVITQLNAALPLFTGLLAVLTIKGGLGIVTSLKDLGLVLPGVVALLTGPAGFALALTALGYESYKAQTAIMALIEAKTKLKESEAQGVAIQERATGSLQRFTETTDIAVKSIDEADKLISSGAVVWSSATNGWVKAGDALADVAGSAAGTVNPFEKSNAAMLDAFAASEKATGAAGKLAAGQKDVATYTMQTVPVFDAATGKIIGYEQKLVQAAGGAIKLGGATAGMNKSLGSSAGVMTELSKKTDLTNKDLIELARVTKDAEVKLTEIASNERIKNIEAKVKLDIANVEANAKVAVSIIEGIGETISTSSKLLGDLFGLLGDPKIQGIDKYALLDQIKIENQLKKEAFELQKKLTEQQIDMMRAQTNALKNGEGLITINGDGLKPHLEAFMWEILSAIQVKVNADGLKLLLGV